ncbi:MAG: sensor histidine kinase [Prevotella sp.]|nr:sensor histidine kinase [Prevotella sp.]
MEKKIVKIPNVAEEVRIGFSFNYLIKVIGETSNFDNVQWDFTDVQFLHPFFLAPLAIYKNTCGENIECVNMSLPIQSYMNSVCFDRMLHFDNDHREDVDAVMERYLDKSFLPFCSFAMTDTNKDSFGSIIQHIITKQTNFKGGSSSLSYLISELLDNIYEHSQSKNGYVFSQYLKKEGTINLCIADTGITIPGSFKKAGLYQEEIDGSDAEALKLANEGYSTKNRPDAENRGYGISTSKKMLVVGMKGAFFMLSGGAFHRYEDACNDYISLKKLFNWKGTIILLRIPVNLPEDFNYINYLE